MHRNRRFEHLFEHFAKNKHGCVDEIMTFFGLFSTTDPFDLNHNLGAGVSRKSEQKRFLTRSPVGVWESTCGLILSVLCTVTNFIMKAFINGRKLFGTPFYPHPGTEVVSYKLTKVCGERCAYIFFYSFLSFFLSLSGVLFRLTGVDRWWTGS